jgi:MOSC domain-containing protein YiiM
MTIEHPPVVLSIQTGKATPIDAGGRQVLSGIGKTPVTGRIKVGKLGLEGDEQADLSVHGVLSKAVYAYPSEHYDYWRKRASPTGETTELPYGSLGENLTLSGLLEGDLFVGDELHFDDCVLRVTQPRHPCFKFNAVMNDRQASKKMTQTGYSGFYLSVKSTGTLSAGERFELVPGPRETSIESLLKVSSFKTRND